ncbi:hypothetical protein C488_07512 [Natrinema pellirubrum DSM 15624]|uniref:Zinc-ribbon domain-containing protein n=1 Tax=Natrinema pellirubrum (strain DSM 15624 / CIP 106293 / JCM 10476 / NCIMB 786 / 157) TaxID=797303 RepID=L0JNI2_NATP1|nr:hypothetical protein [Natrinema pellirubrum]AGB32157.1 hypothetical protein Natpe_2339 [Natrinema pellirubrum DSM 15624]ELY76958.1 hypothetical protein C488_07512 [Natrinema pellirubrum DSM 15624]
MKWRCTRCGKPHASNDPPCDECGHNAFEKAIVRVDDTDDGSSGERSGSEPIPSGTVETGPEYVWACTNCGREHVRNTPPCSRCGNPDLERVERTYEDVERDLDTPSWFEVAKPYLPIFAVIGVVVALFATGIVPPSVLPGIGPPSPPDAPGNASEQAGLDFETTEAAVHDRLEGERTGSDTRRYDDGLAAYAEHQNRGLVAVEFDDREPDAAEPDDFGHDCGDARVVGAPLVLSDRSLTAYDNESAFAADVADGLLSSRFGDDIRSGYDAEGLDVHVAPNGDVYVFYAAC